jgi:hypothetical protein
MQARSHSLPIVCCLLQYYCIHIRHVHIGLVAYLMLMYFIAERAGNKQVLKRNLHLPSPQHQLPVGLLASSFPMHDDSIHCSPEVTASSLHYVCQWVKKNNSAYSKAIIHSLSSASPRTQKHSTAQSNFSPHSDLALLVRLPHVTEVSTCLF